MRTVLRSLLAAAFAIGFASAALADKRVALIVANGAYKGAPLENPTFDADLVAASLANIGFTVKVVKNADLGGFDSAVTRFSADAKDADVALFYFAGHGFAVNEGIRPVSVLMSTSAEVAAGSERVLRAGGIPLDEIVRSVAGQAKATLIFVDACRNDPRVSRAIGGTGRGFQRLDSVQGASLFIGLSTRLGDTADDGQAGKGSPFARAFAAAIQVKGARIDDAFRRLRDAVGAETQGKQLPDIVQDDLPDGAITLVSATAEPPIGDAGAQPTPPGVKPDAKLAEAGQVWASLQDSNDSEALSLFKEQYAGTFYARMAELRLKKIAAKAPAPAPANVVATREAAPDAGDKAATAPAAQAGDCDRLAASPFDAARPAGSPGVVTEQIDVARAVPACRAALAASPNDARMIFQLARALDKGGGADAEVFELYRKAAAAGNVLAFVNLGNKYEHGKGAPKDLAEAVRWYQKAADAGVLPGMFNLGVMYRDGLGVAKDDAEAARWFRKTADAGLTLGMNSLGFMYQMGKGVPKDEAEALRWYRKAADAGAAPAMTNVGVMYRDGIAVAKDEAEAVRWFRKSADAGFALGMTNLGFMYQTGRGIAKDEAEALRWYRKGADAGAPLAMTNLAIMYRDGLGVPKDASEAARWYRKAADAGHAKAMSSLGYAYETGQGISKDEAEALRWYQKAADLGDDYGKAAFKRLSAKTAKTP